MNSAGGLEAGNFGCLVCSFKLTECFMLTAVSLVNVVPLYLSLWYGSARKRRSGKERRREGWEGKGKGVGRRTS